MPHVSGIGPAVVLANWTRTNLSDNEFSVAAGSQLNYLLAYAPRTSDGAISHRADQVQLWYDDSPPLILRYALVIAQ
jgi:hypothetical protein